ncbi:MAG TPA: hypothetical protein VJR26_12950 [Candidatus Acidoferrales bacterium]|nr:hypothetical protein [Candidatus Acidoferrales bacterium]
MKSENLRPNAPSPRSTARDLTCSASGIWFWCVPAIALVVGLRWTPLLPWLWIPAFLIMGLACLVNAARCGRVHCYISGPVFLLAAGYVALAVSLRSIPMVPGPLLDAVLLLVILAFLAETLFGRYRRRD